MIAVARTLGAEVPQVGEASEGDVVDVTAPGGTRSYEIVSVRYV